MIGSSRLIVGLWLALAVALPGCGPHDDVSAGDVLPALRTLGYTYKWRRVARPPGVEKVLAGRATDRRGTTLDFVVAVYDGFPKGQPLPVVPHGEGLSCANYALVDNSADPELSAGRRDRRIEMSARIDRALKRLAPGYHCEG